MVGMEEAAECMLSTKEAGKKLGISQYQVRRLVRQGTIPGKRIGNSWVVLELNYQRQRKPKRTKGGE